MSPKEEHDFESLAGGTRISHHLDTANQFEHMANPVGPHLEFLARLRRELVRERNESLRRFDLNDLARASVPPAVASAPTPAPAPAGQDASAPVAHPPSLYRPRSPR